MLAAFFFLPSCAMIKKGEEKPESVKKEPSVRLAGVIDKVDTSAGFVMIRRYGPWRVGNHECVESRGEGRAANLLPSGEHLGEHIAADIRSGSVKVGDGVYIRDISTSEDKKSSENADSQSSSEQTENKE